MDACRSRECDVLLWDGYDEVFWDVTFDWLL